MFPQSIPSQPNEHGSYSGCTSESSGSFSKYRCMGLTSVPPQIRNLLGSSSGISIYKPRKFLGGLMVRTLHVHCRERGFSTWSGNQDLACYLVQQKRKKGKKNTPYASESTLLQGAELVLGATHPWSQCCSSGSSPVTLKEMCNLSEWPFPNL